MNDDSIQVPYDKSEGQEVESHGHNASQSSDTTCVITELDNLYAEIKQS